MGKDEVVVTLDPENPGSMRVTHNQAPVDMIYRMRKICRGFLIVFLVIYLATIIIQGIMLPTWFTATPMVVAFIAILVVGFLATHGNSFLLSNMLWWFIQPVTALILLAILIYGIVKVATNTGKYGRATILPVVLVGVSTLGAGIGTFLFYKYSRYLKEKR